MPSKVDWVVVAKQPKINVISNKNPNPFGVVLVNLGPGVIRSYIGGLVEDVHPGGSAAIPKTSAEFFIELLSGEFAQGHYELIFH